MYKVLLFAGTTEGVLLAEYCGSAGLPACVFTATEYGASRIAPQASLTIRDGRLQQEDMERVFRTEAAPGAVVIDATHPYADIVTKNIRQACENTGTRYIRVLRESTYGADGARGQVPRHPGPGGQIPQHSQTGCATEPAVPLDLTSRFDDVWVSSPEEAAAFLAGTQGNVLLTTGSKELRHFTSIPDFAERLYPRILPLASNVAATLELGYQASHLICMQGPFSLEMNIALLHFVDARFMVTKDTGKAGGFSVKLEAARACGCRLVIIGRPLQEEGISVEECQKLLREL